MMIIGIPKETRSDESRVAAVPDTIKKLIGLGFSVAVEKGAGDAALIPDSAFEAAGASMVTTAKALGADLVFKVRPPSKDEIGKMSAGSTLISLMEPYSETDTGAMLGDAGVTGYALELVPRITRAQSMDVLSSQANLAGYRAVLEASAVFTRAFPMMMTGGRNSAASQGAGYGCRCCRIAGNRDGQTAWRGGVCYGCAASGERTG
jgi:NAD(P) transhydrogenase subunit alpha